MADASGEVAVSVPWAKCMPYERTEVLNDIKRTFASRLFAPDDISIKEVDRLFCIAGQAPHIVKGLSLDGCASQSRAELFDIIEGKVEHIANDFRCEVTFGACVCDELPSIPLTPLLLPSCTIAKRLWQRARWAMRCGVLKRIGDARAGVDAMTSAESSAVLAASASTSVRPDQPKKRERRPFLPMTRYQKEITSQSITLARFAANAPCLIVAFASWDEASVNFLSDELFCPPESAALDDDPWLRFASKYIDFRDYHEHVAAQAPTAPKPSGGGDVFRSVSLSDQAAAHNAADARLVRQSIPHVYRNFLAFHTPSAALHGSTEDARADAPNRHLKRHQKDGKRRSRWQISGQDNERARHTLEHNVRLMQAAQKEGRRRLRLGNILLVSLDSDSQAATGTLTKLHQRLGVWSSSVVALHCMWGGEDGMHSDVGNFLNAGSLPFVCAAQPERVRLAGDEVLWYDSPVVTMTQGLRRGTAYRRPSLAGSALAPQAETKKPKLHDLEAEERRELLQPLLEFLEDNEAQLTFTVETVAEYGVLDPPVADSTLKSAASISSSLILRGTATEGFARTVQPMLEHISSRVRGVWCDVNVIEEAPPLRLTINPREAEHRVHGWGSDVTCKHCKQRVLLAKQPHFRCLHCNANDASVCTDCVLKHDQSHVMLLLFEGTSDVVHTLWGATNVQRLPMIRGRLVANATGQHVGVYCNSCCVPVHGVRWKCAMCHDADLCGECFDTWRNSVRISNTKERRHPLSHRFLRIACAVPGDANVFLAPRTSTLAV